MNKTTKKKIYDNIDKLHKKYPKLTYEPGFGFIYKILLYKECSNQNFDLNIIDQFYNIIENIDYYNNGFLLGNLNSNNSSTKKKCLKELTGNDFFKQIEEIWWEFSEEIYAQYERRFAQYKCDFFG